MADMTIDQAMQLALTQYHQGQLPQAEHLCRTILAHNRDHPDALSLLGILAFIGQRSDVSLDLLQRAVMLQPDRAEFQCNLGNVLLATSQFQAAITAYQKVLASNPNLAAIHTNIGNAYSRLGRLDEAVAAHQNAVRLEPNLAEAHTNLGHILSEQGKVDQAIEAHRTALALKPDFPEVHWNLALCKLVQGDFAGGWPDFEWRWKCAEHLDNRAEWQRPMWDGSDLAGKMILLRSEQGFGDTLQFIRYAQLVKDRGGTVMVECQPELIPLLRQISAVSRWIARGEVLPEFDVWYPLMSLPKMLATTLDTIPAQSPLTAPADRVETFAKRLPAAPGMQKFGIVWAGRPEHKNDRNRSMTIKALAKLLQVPLVQFISLQKGPAAEQLKHLDSSANVIDLTTELNDFVDTAALISNLDLVISVDTAVAHLAGAMGKPVWVLLPFAPDWRWMLDRTDSPWYPTMRLFRQTRSGGWSEVVDRVVAEIDTFKTV